MKRAVLVYFSPTHTTQKVVKAIANGLGVKTVVDYNLTIENDETISIKDGDVIIIGGPVYGGRLPAVAKERLSRIKGAGQPAICVAVYGNNRYGDALAELGDIILNGNMLPVAGACFIGEHSYANEEFQVALGRPNSEDLSLAKEFGLKVKKELEAIKDISKITPIVFPGEVTNELPPTFPKAASIATDDCIKCNICIDVCPVGAIDQHLICDDSKCIKCFACVKSCPSKARVFENPRYEAFALKLSKLDDKSPEFFYL